MDLSAVRTGLAIAASSVVSDPKLTCFGYMPDSIPEPAFVVGSVLIDFDETMNRGSDELLVTCWVLTSRSDDKAGQKALDGYLKGSGASSLKAALEVDKTLGGVCDWIRLERVRGYKTYEFGRVGDAGAGDSIYFGAELVVRVGGNGD